MDLSLSSKDRLSDTAGRCDPPPPPPRDDASAASRSRAGDRPWRDRRKAVFDIADFRAIADFAGIRQKPRRGR
ncbi:hypothetical protein [Roseicella sp. DB1501]|uniref:hypothetical protein n=1 Tax=Roseicella sp. DB1501 TaxID=2730925 RepID=UPI00149267B7|nr:hypothetical protein [Roseicella sp. DB1501]NOG69215.1 hypothetical protein [Roseicella sp. DB1501]